MGTINGDVKEEYDPVTGKIRSGLLPYHERTNHRDAGNGHAAG